MACPTNCNPPYKRGTGGGWCCCTCNCCPPPSCDRVRYSWEVGICAGIIQPTCNCDLEDCLTVYFSCPVLGGNCLDGVFLDINRQASIFPNNPIGQGRPGWYGSKLITCSGTGSGGGAGGFCDNCNPTPDSVTLTLSTIANDTCTNCALMNGTYVLNYIGFCQWQCIGIPRALVGICDDGMVVATLTFTGLQWQLELASLAMTIVYTAASWDCNSPLILTQTSQNGCKDTGTAVITANRSSSSSSGANKLVQVWLWCETVTNTLILEVQCGNSYIDTILTECQTGSLVIPFNCYAGATNINLNVYILPCLSTSSASASSSISSRSASSASCTSECSKCSDGTAAIWTYSVSGFNSCLITIDLIGQGGRGCGLELSGQNVFSIGKQEIDYVIINNSCGCIGNPPILINGNAPPYCAVDGEALTVTLNTSRECCICVTNPIVCVRNTMFGLRKIKGKRVVVLSKEAALKAKKLHFIRRKQAISGHH